MIKLIISLVAVALFPIHENRTSTILISVSSIDVKQGGQLSVAIFDKANFLNHDKCIAFQSVAAGSENIVLRFEHIPAGRYSIAAFQDINSDKKLSTNFIGLPTEPYGFSYVEAPRFGPPTFESTCVEVKAGETNTINILLK